MAAMNNITRNPPPPNPLPMYVLLPPAQDPKITHIATTSALPPQGGGLPGP